MKTRHLTNQDVHMPPEYEEMMRYYLPDVPKALIVDAWKHNATPLEVMRHFERIEGQARSKHDRNRRLLLRGMRQVPSC